MSITTCRSVQYVYMYISNVLARLKVQWILKNFNTYAYDTNLQVHMYTHIHETNRHILQIELWMRTKVLNMSEVLWYGNYWLGNFWLSSGLGPREHKDSFSPHCTVPTVQVSNIYTPRTYMYSTCMTHIHCTCILYHIISYTCTLQFTLVCNNSFHKNFPRL